jgi:hypothetical protein
LPLKIIRGNHWEIIGRGTILLSNPPSVDQAGEHYTGRMVEEVALLSKAHALIELEGMKKLDSLALGPAMREFQSSIERFVDDFKIKCLIEIIGKDESGIEIRTAQTESDPKELIDLMKDRFAGDFDLRIGLVNSDERDAGSKKIKVISLGLGPEERGFRKDLVVSRIAHTISLLNTRLGYSETDERASGILG